MTLSTPSAAPLARIGIIGPGSISSQYIRTLLRCPDVDLAFIAGRNAERARDQAEHFGIGQSGSVAELLKDECIDLVLNLTTPEAHFDVSMDILTAGKHLWSEKPAAMNHSQVDEIARLSGQHDLRVGVAPDTFLGAGIQESLRLAATGALGTLTGALAVMQKPGPEAWHPDPEFLYRKGAGPLHDIGVYYLTALVQFLGPLAETSATGFISPRTRTIAAGPRAGTTFQSDVPTVMRALYRFESGAEASAMFSFDAYRDRTILEIEGNDGELSVPDPDGFDGPIELRLDGRQPTTITTSNRGAGRGVGVIDLVRSLGAGQPHRASLELAAHVLDAMDATLEAAQTDRVVPIGSSVTTPRPLAAGWNPFVAAQAE